MIVHDTSTHTKKIGNKVVDFAYEKNIERDANSFHEERDHGTRLTTKKTIL